MNSESSGASWVSREVQTKIDRESLPENQIEIAEELNDTDQLVEEIKRFLSASLFRSGEDDFEPFPPPEGIVTTQVDFQIVLLTETTYIY
jgi:hypothetical protein